VDVLGGANRRFGIDGNAPKRLLRDDGRLALDVLGLEGKRGSSPRMIRDETN
jgi:hypothetical protein